MLRPDKSKMSAAVQRTPGGKPAPGAGALLRFRNNQMIFNEGDEANYFYMVVSGRVRLCKMRYDGRRQIVDLMIPGDIFGFEYGTEHTFTAEAIGKTVLDSYSCRPIERLSEERLDVRRDLMTMLHHNLSSVRNHMVLLGRETARERVATFLATLAIRFRITGRGVMDLGMGRRDIADYLGLALETVCRELSGLRHAGLIEILDHRRIAVLDMAALQSISEGLQQRRPG
ncbi:MAG: cyclic nucleotide-binding domain-containing protein [Alphaproteobacteria bacterium]|nr:cyclic nucleotide-binding domain-containing protein [Alphaproteobacteria bacterium]MDE2012025.1 cyclic nucleotide-binding domain-containing protein [Alphaproteobacteria bacterium]MDE2073853.1 cyclic nucleotide-binding domain-containing protein [Alphaproteobacteria bacterium]